MAHTTPDHTNYHEIYCCPGCMRSSEFNVKVTEKPTAVDCPECGVAFYIWVGTTTVYCSAAELDEDDLENEEEEE